MDEKFCEIFEKEERVCYRNMKEAHGLSHELLLIKNVMLRQLLSPEFQPVCSKFP